jgi:hypothetical protein
MLIPFIILGARPTSTPGPKRDQLVWEHRALPDIEAKYASLPKIESMLCHAPLSPTNWVLLRNAIGHILWNTLRTCQHNWEHDGNEII